MWLLSFSFLSQQSTNSVNHQWWHQSTPLQLNSRKFLGFPFLYNQPVSKLIIASIDNFASWSKGDSLASPSSSNNPHLFCQITIMLINTSATWFQVSFFPSSTTINLFSQSTIASITTFASQSKAEIFFSPQVTINLFSQVTINHFSQLLIVSINIFTI